MQLSMSKTSNMLSLQTRVAVDCIALNY